MWDLKNSTERKSVNNETEIVQAIWLLYCDFTSTEIAGVHQAVCSRFLSTSAPLEYWH